MVAKHSTPRTKSTQPVAGQANAHRGLAQPMRARRTAAPTIEPNRTIRVESPTLAENWALIQKCQATLHLYLPAQEFYPLTPEELSAPNVTVFVTRVDDRPVACVVLVDCNTYGEARHIFVHEQFRGQGIAQAMMQEVERYCGDIGILRVKLESNAILKIAESLYDSLGFQPCDPFGDYAVSENSVFLEKELGRLN